MLSECVSVKERQYEDVDKQPEQSHNKRLLILDMRIELTSGEKRIEELGQAANPLNVPPTLDLCNMRGYVDSGIGGIFMALRGHLLGATNLVDRSLEGTQPLAKNLSSSVAKLALGLSPAEVEGYIKADGTSSNRVLIDHARKTTGRELVICSALGHKSIHQAAHGHVKAINVSKNNGFQMETQTLLSALNENVGVLVLTGGTTELGIIENLSPEVEKKCRELGIWIHLDAAYGGMNIGCLPEKYSEQQNLRKLAASGAVKTITVCPHKFVGSYGCSIAFIKGTANFESGYIPGANALSGTSFPMETAYKTNQTIKKLGERGLNELAESTYMSAKYFAQVLKYYGIQTIVPVQSGIVPIELPSKEIAQFLCNNLRALGFSVPEPFSIHGIEREVHGVRLVFTPSVYYDICSLEDLGKIVSYILTAYKSQ